MAKYGVNKATLIGNLGRDPEVRYLDSGVAVANFPLATSERYRNKEGNYVDRTEWHNIVMWRGLAETAGKYLKKGSTIYIEGRITTRSWDDAEGQKKYRTEIEASEMLMLDSRDANSGGNTNEPPLSSYSQGSNTNTSQNQGSNTVNEPKVNQVSNQQSDVPDDLPF